MSKSGETILLVERPGRPEHTFAAALAQKGYVLEVVPTGQMALTRIEESTPLLVILNAASLGSSGLRICRQLKAQAQGVPMIHIVPPGDPELTDTANGVAQVTLIMPFTPRKLINRMKGLLPSSRHDAIEMGAIHLIPSAQIVEAYGQRRRLTARTANLLKVFLKHPGKVLDRGFLMRQVWNTDYVGDTRTLDVHVRWVREAIEPDPRNPRHVLTVRGKGYRFDPGEV